MALGMECVLFFLLLLLDSAPDQKGTPVSALLVGTTTSGQQRGHPGGVSCHVGSLEVAQPLHPTPSGQLTPPHPRSAPPPSRLD